ncbi:MAG: hypothetical protein B6D39_06755 [Anaerolineae bacterium UTCFX2]|jgi:SAM-dependent methyltransferase|nr:class I SAM-dependent methyltransferase [Anaerolineales bacterium]OQY91530.1 MAG: hypothetical protein B6D39_06755 [Anaerolineae bacterium UTCFX2]
MIEITHCDLCGSSEYSPFLRRIDRVSGQEFLLVQCRACGLIYLRNRPSPETIASFYPEDYECFTRAGETSSGLQSWHQRRAMNMRLDFIEKYAGNPGILLDIGCGTGDFLVSARNRGWQVKGIELVERAAQIAREVNGLDVLTGSIENLAGHPERYRVITLWDVLEHLPSPRSAFQLIHELLQEDGLLVFSIPNLTSFDRYLFSASWIGWDVPRHFFLFNKENIQQLCELSGFKIIEDKTFIGGKGTFQLSLIQRFPSQKKIVLAADPFLSMLLYPYRQISYALHRGPISVYVLTKR